MPPRPRRGQMGRNGTLPIILLAHTRAFPLILQAENTPSGATEMTACHDMEIERTSIPSKIVTVLLFLMAQLVAVLMIGSVISYADAVRLGIDVDITVSGPTI